MDIIATDNKIVELLMQLGELLSTNRCASSPFCANIAMSSKIQTARDKGSLLGPSHTLSLEAPLNEYRVSM